MSDWAWDGRIDDLPEDLREHLRTILNVTPDTLLVGHVCVSSFSLVEDAQTPREMVVLHAKGWTGDIQVGDPEILDEAESVLAIRIDQAIDLHEMLTTALQGLAAKRARHQASQN